MAKTRLDAALLTKIAKKKQKTEQYVREQISRRASRSSISSEAAQILWAKELGFATASALRRLDPHIQQQVTSAGVAAVAPSSNGRASRTRSTARVSKSPSATAALNAAIDLLLSDGQLKHRCADLLRARRNFDRVLREATTVFDARLQALAQFPQKVNPGELVSRTLAPKGAILVVSKHADEQEGFFLLCKGLMAAFRNPSHHTLNDKLTREDALRFCGFVDSLLTIVGKAQVKPAGPTTSSASMT
jgi:hypothetical protein